jgi:hypothetical protein
MKAIVVALTLMLFPQFAFACGDDGHKIVARQARLDDALGPRKMDDGERLPALVARRCPALT